jgi:hypothetical protein
MVLKAFHLWLLAMLAAAVLLHAPEVSANPELLQAEARVASAILDLEAARARLADATEEQRRLAERIAASKTKGGGRELERLLQASLESERQVAARSREASERSNMVRRAIDEAFRKAASEFRVVKPELRSKDAARRERAQQSVALIQKMRARLKDHQLAVTQPHESTPKDWERYDQKPSKNDGPEELRAKADFVADHRDKFKKKRQELLKLIEEARQERELSRIAANFQQDAFLYDENARSGRVARGTTNELAAAGNNDTNRGYEAAPPVAGGVAQQNPPPANPSPPLAADSDPNGAFNSPTEGRGTDIPKEDSATGGQPNVPTPPAATPSLGASVPLPREFNPTALLNLEIDRIDAASVSLEQLLSTLKNLEKLDELLARREAELTTKATQLEQAEKSGTK